MTLPGVLGGRYEPRAKIGGRMLRAWDPRLRREVAIKLLDAPRPGPEALARHAAAVQAARKVAVPGLVLPLEVVTDTASPPFVVLELLSGVDLDGLRARLGALMWARAADLTCRCAEVLVAVAAATGLAHRDLKPGNVWITESGNIRLLDFGAAELGLRPVGARSDGVFVEYRAPEQLDGAAGDPRSDVYTLGVLLFEMTTGVHPFAAPSAFKVAHNVLLQPVPSLAALVPGMPAAAVREVEEVLLRALARRPEDRFADVAELLRALETARRSIGSPVHRPAPTPTPVLAPKPAPVAPPDDYTTMMRAPVPRELRAEPVVPRSEAPRVPGGVALIENPAAADGPDLLSDRTEVDQDRGRALRAEIQRLRAIAPLEPAPRREPEPAPRREPEPALAMRTFELPRPSPVARAAPESTVPLDGSSAPGEAGDAPTEVHMREPSASASASVGPYVPPPVLLGAGDTHESRASLQAEAAPAELGASVVAPRPESWTSQRTLIVINVLCAIFIAIGVVLLWV